MAEKNDQKMRESPERAEKFQAKLQELLALAKKKKNMLEYQEINDHFKDFAVSPELIDKILDFEEANHVAVLRITADDGDIVTFHRIVISFVCIINFMFFSIIYHPYPVSKVEIFSFFETRHSDKLFKFFQKFRKKCLHTFHFYSIVYSCRRECWNWQTG